MAGEDARDGHVDGRGGERGARGRSGGPLPRLGDGPGAGIARQLAGVALKDSAEDASRLRYYVDTVVRERARTDARWREFLGAATDLWG